MNYVKTITAYLDTVRNFRESRKILKEQQQILNSWKELKATYHYRSRAPRRILIREHKELAQQVINAERLYGESKHLLNLYRPIIRLSQNILHERLSVKEKKILLDFLSNPNKFTELPNRLLGLIFISPKLLTEVLAKKLYSE